MPGALGIGAAVGAAVGTLNEVLTKHGIGEEDAAYYGSRLKHGGVIVVVDDPRTVGADQAAGILSRHGGHNAGSAR